MPEGEEWKLWFDEHSRYVTEENKHDEWIRCIYRKVKVQAPPL